MVLRNFFSPKHLTILYFLANNNSKDCGSWWLGSSVFAVNYLLNGFLLQTQKNVFWLLIKESLVRPLHAFQHLKFVALLLDVTKLDPEYLLITFTESDLHSFCVQNSKGLWKSKYATCLSYAVRSKFGDQKQGTTYTEERCWVGTKPVFLVTFSCSPTSTLCFPSLRVGFTYFVLLIPIVGSHEMGFRTDRFSVLSTHRILSHWGHFSEAPSWCG